MCRNARVELACIATVFVDQRAKNGVFGVLPARKMGREQSPCNSLLPNRTETLATQATAELPAYQHVYIPQIESLKVYARCFTQILDDKPLLVFFGTGFHYKNCLPRHACSKLFYHSSRSF